MASKQDVARALAGDKNLRRADLTDARATDPKTGETWTVHYPELHGLAKLRD